MQSAHPRVLLETDIKQKAQRDRPHWERQLWGNRGFASRAAKKEHGLRLPASASCLGRHSHPAGRCPNSSSLFRPLAAVVAVALGCFCAVFSDVAAAVRIHPRLWPQRSYIRKTPVYFYTSVFLVGAGGFEPPKLKAADLQSVPIGHSGTRPYSLFAILRTACIYYHRFSSLSIFFRPDFQIFALPGRQHPGSGFVGSFVRLSFVCLAARGLPLHGPALARSFFRAIRRPVISRFTAKNAQESAFLSVFCLELVAGVEPVTY